jgi:opacity protein-like surface antigen
MVSAATAVATTPAAAQNYDGGAIVKFGVFWQGTQTNFSQVRNGISDGSGTQDGWLHGGLSVGLDINLPYQWMIGVEMDGSFGDARGTINAIDYGFDYLFNMRGRLGYYMRPDLMIYGATGLSYLGFEAQSQGVGRLKASETVTGWNAGIGLEYTWHHVILFGEYSHSVFQGREFTIGNDRIKADADADVFRLGMKFKVGHDHYHGLGRVYDLPPLK